MQHFGPVLSGIARGRLDFFLRNKFYNGFNFVYFLDKGRYVIRDIGSLFPPNKGQEVSVYKLFLTVSLLPSDKSQEVSGCELFLGGWFVCSRHSGVTWVGKL